MEQNLKLTTTTMKKYVIQRMKTLQSDDPANYQCGWRVNLVNMTRLDICYSTQILSQFMQPKRSHMESVMKGF